MSGNDWWNKCVFSLWQKSVREADDWISGGKLFQGIDVANGNECRPTVARRHAGTCSRCDEDERRRRRPGRSATRISWSIAIAGRYVAEHSVFISDEAVDTTVYTARCRWWRFWRRSFATAHSSVASVTALAAPEFVNDGADKSPLLATDDDVARTSAIVPMKDSRAATGSCRRSRTITVTIMCVRASLRNVDAARRNVQSFQRRHLQRRRAIRKEKHSCANSAVRAAFICWLGDSVSLCASGRGLLVLCGAFSKAILELHNQLPLSFRRSLTAAFWKRKIMLLLTQNQHFNSIILML